jgi:CheY-like chemotaxis protein
MKNGKPLILCVDDDPDFRESTRMILEANGYRVEEAASAEEGIRKFKAERPACILVDLMMEEIDSGTNFVKELRLLGQKPPTFMLSSAGDAFAGMTSYADLGLDGMFQKPINPAQLLSTLRQRIGK